MLHAYKNFLLLAFASAWLMGCVHLYYPMNGQASRREGNDLADYAIDGTLIDINCSWKKVNGRRTPAPRLCDFTSKLLSQEKAELLADRDENAAEATADLKVVIDGKALITDSSMLELNLLFISFGLYPANVDRWFSVELSIYDRQNKLLEQGTFKALFRTYYGWGYWLADQTMTLPGSQPSRDYRKENSDDFYQFVMQKIYNARMQQETSTAAIGGS